VELFTGWGFFPVEKERRIGNKFEEAPTFFAVVLIGSYYLPPPLVG
jgi:hypothetical protein